MAGLAFIIRLLAFLCFALRAFGVPSRVDLIAVGLALLTLASMLGGVTL
jgi:hypothetical protein